MKAISIIFSTTLLLVACNPDDSHPTRSNTVSTKPATRLPITFKDIPFGTPGVKPALIEICKKDENNKHFRDLFGCKFKDELNIISVSYGNLSFASGYILIGKEETLEEVSLRGNSSEILGLAEILEEKYGPPMKTTENLQNNFGAKFDKQIFIWHDAQGNKITINSITNDIKSGSITIQSSAHAAKIEKAKTEEREISKSKL